MCALNPYFQTYTCPAEQNLLEDALVEQIAMAGVSVKYLPRATVDIDQIFREDVTHKFDIAAEIEVYVKNVEGFEGEGDILRQFQLEIRDQITFTIARRRWEQLLTEKLLSEEGQPYEDEVSAPWTEVVDGLTISHDDMTYRAEAGDGRGYSITHPTPREGDIIYFPLVRRFFTIMKVEHESMFYPMGRLMTYDLKCELLEYSSEVFDTGDAVIDALEDQLSADVLFNELLAEDGTRLLDEDGGRYINEDGDDTTPQDVQDQDIDLEAEKFGVLDFSEHNPFSENREF